MDGGTINMNNLKRALVIRSERRLRYQQDYLRELPMLWAFISHGDHYLLGDGAEDGEDSGACLSPETHP